MAMINAISLPKFWVVIFIWLQVSILSRDRSLDWDFEELRHRQTCELNLVRYNI